MARTARARIRESKFSSVGITGSESPRSPMQVSSAATTPPICSIRRGIFMLGKMMGDPVIIIRGSDRLVKASPDLTLRSRQAFSFFK